MISEQQLRELERDLALFRRTGREEFLLRLDELPKLVAAARVANAAARVEREERDKAKRGNWDGKFWIPPDAGIDRADWQLARALARYTQPQQVNA